MKRTPTDIDILDRIYNNYYEEFSTFSKDKPNRQTKIFIPIDIKKIADDLNVMKTLSLEGCTTILKNALVINTMMVRAYISLL